MSKTATTFLEKDQVYQLIKYEIESAHKMLELGIKVPTSLGIFKVRFDHLLEKLNELAD